MEKCLYCYKPLKPGQIDYHPACARKLFGTKEAPVLPYIRKEIGDLAKQVVRAQTTLTGVQAKLSLDVNPGGKNEPSRFTIVGLWENTSSSPKPTAIAVFRKSKISRCISPKLLKSPWFRMD